MFEEDLPDLVIDTQLPVVSEEQNEALSKSVLESLETDITNDTNPYDTDAKFSSDEE